jgi:hypothetical protein
MIFNILIVGLVLGLAYAWMVRGFFSAFLHLLCVLVAGALAFAAWEPLAYLLIGMAPERGLFSFLDSAAWGIALLVPFVVFLLLTRLAADKIVPGNLKNATAADYAGGAVCGLGVGVLTAGVFVIGVQGLRLPTSLGYQPIWYTEERAAGAGSLTHADRLWIPADRITAGIYQNISEGSLSARNSLARWHPDLGGAAFAARISPGEGAGRNAISPDDFRVLKTYTVGSAERPAAANELLTFAGSTTPQRYIDIHGEPVAKGHLLGIVVQFEPAAREKGGRGGGQVIVSNGQAQLIAHNDATGDSVTIFPVAAVSENAEADGRLGRWKFDANDVFISSVGAQSQPVFAFEFLVPEGYTPLGLHLRQARWLVSEMPAPVVIDSTGERDRRVTSGSILRAEGAARTQRNDANAVTIDGSAIGGRGGASGSGVSLSASLGEMVSSQTARSRLDLDDDNRIANGQAKFLKSEVGRGNAPTARSMRVDSFALGANQTMVQVDVSPGMAASFVSEAARLAPTDRPIVLVDNNGNEFQAIGFIYSDRETFEVRYTLGNTLSGISDTPTISTARDDQKLVILFVVTTDATIEQLAAGDIVLANFRPALTARGG